MEKLQNLQNIMDIPPAAEEIRQMASKKGFIRLYEQLIKTCKTYRNAYEVLEQQYIRIFGERKYASYEAFKAVYWRKQRKK